MGWPSRPSYGLALSASCSVCLRPLPFLISYVLARKLHNMNLIWKTCKLFWKQIKSVRWCFSLTSRVDKEDLSCFLIRSNSYNLYPENKWHQVYQTFARHFNHIMNCDIKCITLALELLSPESQEVSVSSVVKRNESQEVYLKSGKTIRVTRSVSPVW